MTDEPTGVDVVLTREQWLEMQQAINEVIAVGKRYKAMLHQRDMLDGIRDTTHIHELSRSYNQGWDDGIAWFKENC